MPDTVDRLSIIADRLIQNAEIVSAQMKLVTSQLQEILMAGIDEDNSNDER